MKYPEGRTLDTLQRAQGFLDAHASALSSINQSSVRKVLDDTVVRLAEHVRDQQHGVVNSTSEMRRQRALCEALRVAMRPFVTAAKLTADDVTPPELRTLSLPAADSQAQLFIGAASAMSQLARENEQLLHAGGLSEDAIAKLGAARDAFARSIEGRDGRVAWPAARRTRCGRRLAMVAASCGTSTRWSCR